VCIEFATGDSLDESEQFADNEVELRRVSGVNAATTQPSLVVTHLLLGLLHWLQNCKLGHDSRRARSATYTPPTQLNYSTG